jgi:t-SNARE complex subunit (syntaxin)
MQDMTEAMDGAPFHNENSTTGRFQTYPSTQYRCQIVTAHTSKKELDNYKTRKKENRRLPKKPIFSRNNPENIQKNSKKTQKITFRQKIIFIINAFERYKITDLTRPNELITTMNKVAMRSPERT